MDGAKQQIGSLLLIGILVAFCTSQSLAQSPSVAASSTASDPRIEQLEKSLAALQLEVDSLRQRCGRLEMIDGGLSCLPASLRCDDTSADIDARLSHYVTYDNGWVIRPYHPSRVPFELKFNVHNQFRYTGFANTVDSFTDSANNTRPITTRNDFDINRGRFVFSGYAFDPRMTFYTNIDYNTVANNPVLLLLSWISFEHSEALKVSMGLGKVPGTWEWQESSRFTLGAERTMATTFFRPSITAGIWAEGKLAEGLYYEALVGDGFNTFTLRAAELDPNLAYSVTTWWEPRGEFKTGFSDLECHRSLSVRLGHGFTYAANDADPVGEPGPEQTVIRLSDGTRLVETGALAPTVTVNEFDISLYAVHLGLKYRGFSLATEYFFRWLTGLKGNGPLPVSSLFDSGFFVQGGAFVIPKRLELYAIGSQVHGDYGTGSEVGAGLNYYVGGRRGNRFTFDVTYIDDSPTEQDRTGLVAGGSGTLFRAQWWHFF